MITDTDLANYALVHIGEPTITDIEDTTTTARTCARLVGPTKSEVIRSHRWNCAIARATLAQLATAPVHGLDHAYQLPGDFVRLLEVNGEAWEGSDKYFEIESDSVLLTDEDSVDIRYLKQIEVHEMDPLMVECTALKLASKIAVPITAKLDLQTQMLNLYLRSMKKAAQTDAVETKSREGNLIHRLIRNSALVRSRRIGRYSQTQFYNKYPTW